MRWSIRLNTEHIFVWLRALIAWWAFVAVAVVLGWSYKPRLDEIAFAFLGLPALATAVYATWCLLLAGLRMLWTIWRDRLFTLRVSGQDIRRYTRR